MRLHNGHQDNKLKTNPNNDKSFLGLNADLSEIIGDNRNDSQMNKKTPAF